jgi:hypothetical protein
MYCRLCSIPVMPDISGPVGGGALEFTYAAATKNVTGAARYHSGASTRPTTSTAADGLESCRDAAEGIVKTGGGCRWHLARDTRRYGLRSRAAQYRTRNDGLDVDLTDRRLGQGDCRSSHRPGQQAHGQRTRSQRGRADPTAPPHRI